MNYSKWLSMNGGLNHWLDSYINKEALEHQCYIYRMRISSPLRTIFIDKIQPKQTTLCLKCKSLDWFNKLLHKANITFAHLRNKIMENVEKMQNCYAMYSRCILGFLVFTLIVVLYNYLWAFKYILKSVHFFSFHSHTVESHIFYQLIIYL